MSNYPFISGWTHDVTRRAPPLSFAIALLAAALLPVTAFAAPPQAPAKGTHVPVIVNVYSNANVSTQYIADAIAEANKILGQANIRLVPVKINDPVTAANNGDDGDGVFTRAERDAIRTFGGKEVAGLPGSTGMKISFGQQVNATNASNIGVAVHRDPTIIVQKYGSPTDTARTIAHEAAHVFTLGAYHQIATGISADKDGHSATNNPGPAGEENLMAPKHTPGATNLTKLQIEEMNKEVTTFGFSARQFKENCPAVVGLVQSGAARDDHGDAISSGGHGADVKDIHDLQRVWVGSEQGVPTLTVSLGVGGVIPSEGTLEALYALGLDTDNNPLTGVSYAGRAGIDRIVRVEVSRPTEPGPLLVQGFVEDPMMPPPGMLLPGPIELLTEPEFNDREGPTVPIGTTIAFQVPKSMLALTAPQVPIVAAAGIPAEFFDTVELTFDQMLYAHRPDLRLYGSGVPRAGVPYPFTLTRMSPNQPVQLYLDDTLVYNGTLNAAGNCSGCFLPPLGLENDSLHFLTALDQTESFAGNITSPKPELSISARQVGMEVELCFDTSLGVDYVVERAEEVLPPGWEIWDIPTGTGEPVVMKDTLEPGGRYYRVGMQSVNMDITQIAMPNPVRVGQELTYTLEVKNLGGPPARKVQIFDPLPASVEYISAEVLPPEEGNCVYSDGMLTCELLNPLLPGPGVSVVIRVRPQQPGSLENTAIVANPAPDPVAGNDSATVVTTVLP